MEDNRTKLYDATYTDKKGEKHSLHVRVNPRLVALFLSLTLVASTSACKIVNSKGENAPKKVHEITFEEEDIKAIEEIIKNYPEMLSHKELITHAVLSGENLSVIAEMYGTTVKDIQELNKDILSSDGILQIGTNLKVEKSENLAPEDALINVLESYIYDYFLGCSHISKTVNNNEINDKQISVYKNAIYGEGKDQEIDSHSIYGHAIRAYATYHDEEIEPTKERKETYINALQGIVKEIEQKINMGGNARVVIPYSEYENYCYNKSTEHQVSYTPYGNRIS